MSVLGRTMFFTMNSFLGILVILFNMEESNGTEEPTRMCMNQFEYQFDVIKKLAWLDEQVRSLQQSNQDAARTIDSLTKDLELAKLSADGGTYTRWGRTVCPEGAILVYHGYAAGAHYTHEGSGANRLCLTNEPTWNYYTDTINQAESLIYGMEYQIHGFDQLKDMLNHDVPCSVCRIPRSDILMIPGTNICPANYKMEYTGYIMSGKYNQKGPSDFICVDDNPESVKGGERSTDQSLLYLVQAICGSLECPPYVDGREVTCVVCSHSYNTAVYAPDG